MQVLPNALGAIMVASRPERVDASSEHLFFVDWLAGLGGLVGLVGLVRLGAAWAARPSQLVGIGFAYSAGDSLAR